MSIYISSSSNETIKNIAKLAKSPKERKQQGLFIVEGIRMFREIPLEWLKKVYVSDTGYEKYSSQIDENMITAKVSDKAFLAMSDTGTPQGILALVKIPKYSMEDIILKDVPFVLVVDRLQDPGNLGTIIRAAEAAGVTGIMISSDSVDAFSPKVVRATMGAIYRVPLYVSNNLISDINYMKSKGVTVYGAHLDGETFYENDYRKPSAFLIGNEGNGLSDEVSNTADSLIRIPMKGKIESLNAAMSTAIISYEVLRQRLNFNT